MNWPIIILIVLGTLLAGFIAGILLVNFLLRGLFRPLESLFPFVRKKPPGGAK